MTMTWLIVALVLIGVVGPVFWLLPSQRERQVGRMRAAARCAGLVVEFALLPKMAPRADELVSAGGVAKAPTTACMRYGLPSPHPSPAAPTWRALKSNASDAPLPGWTFHGEASRSPVPADYWQRVGAIVNALPGACVAVESGPGQVAWYGHERCDGQPADAVVGAIRDGLTALAALSGEACSG